MKTKTIDWIQTFTGRRVRPLAATTADIDIRDIAHALAHQCRFSGHVRTFYSVAEHSVMVSMEVPPEHALAGLLHDASEAYLVDIPTPIKAMLPGYVAMEKKLERVIADKFSLSWELPQEVKDADRRLLAIESRAMMNGSLEGWGLSFDFDPPVFPGLSSPAAPEQAEDFFLTRFHELTREIGK